MKGLDALVLRGDCDFPVPIGYWVMKGIVPREIIVICGICFFVLLLITSPVCSQKNTLSGVSGLKILALMNSLSRFIHQLLNPNYFPVFYECANPPFPVLTFCPRFLIKSPFYESFLMETQRENGRNIDFLMTGHIPPIEVFRPLVRITISP